MLSNAPHPIRAHEKEAPLRTRGKLLESLEDVYLAPVSVVSEQDLNAVKDQFFQGVLLS